MTTLSELLGALESAREPSPELDLELAYAFTDESFATPKYTSSLDAAVSLCSAVLPEASWQVGPGHAIIFPRDSRIEQFYEHMARQAQGPALALCTAVVKAKIAMEAQEE